jgi:hypothetical protein
MLAQFKVHLLMMIYFWEEEYVHSVHRKRWFSWDALAEAHRPFFFLSYSLGFK